jgi:hypothetical protein
MATVEQRIALLAITCSWCHSAPGEFCTRPAGRNSVDSQDGVRRQVGLPISTLDGGCHDARWQAAGLGSAPVLTEVVAALRETAIQPAGRPRTGARAPAPAAAMAGGERPW